VCNSRHRHKVKIDGDCDISYCERCLSEIFPFGKIASNREYKDTILEFSWNKRHLAKLSKLKINPLDEDLRQALAEITSTLGGCKYYDEKKFCKFVGNLGRHSRTDFSLLCHNIRSLPKNEDEFEAYLGTLGFDFDIICFTETFLNEVSANFATIVLRIVGKKWRGSCHLP
jgi:hypothetical protein